MRAEQTVPKRAGRDQGLQPPVGGVEPLVEGRAVENARRPARGNHRLRVGQAPRPSASHRARTCRPGPPLPRGTDGGGSASRRRRPPCRARRERRPRPNTFRRSGRDSWHPGGLSGQGRVGRQPSQLFAACERREDEVPGDPPAAGYAPADFPPAGCLSVGTARAPIYGTSGRIEEHPATGQPVHLRVAAQGAGRRPAEHFAGNARLFRQVVGAGRVLGLVALGGPDEASASPGLLPGLRRAGSGRATCRMAAG